MRIHHLNGGTMCPMSARLVNGRGSLFEAELMVCHCLLLETKDGLALVTGLGTEDCADPALRLGRTVRRGISWTSRKAATRGSASIPCGR